MKNYEVNLMRTSGIKSNLNYRLMKLFHYNPIFNHLSNPYELLKEAGITEGQIVLEVGCGNGYYTIPAADMISNNGKIFALDINSIAISEVTEKMNDNKLHNIVPLHKDAMNTGLDDNSIDLSFFFGVPRLFRMQDVFNKVFNEIYRITKPHGTVVIKSGNQKLISRVESFHLKLIKGANKLLIFQK